MAQVCLINLQLHSTGAQRQRLNRSDRSTALCVVTMPGHMACEPCHMQVPQKTNINTPQQMIVAGCSSQLCLTAHGTHIVRVLIH